MDDLFHSLSTSGHGTHTRTRPDGAAQAPDGRTFGATYEALRPSETVASPAMSGEGVAEDEPQLSFKTRAGIDTPAGDGDVERPQTLPPNEVQTDPSNSIPSIDSDGPDSATIAPMSATNIAINAQISDAGHGGARRGWNNVAAAGPLSLPTADNGTALPSGQASDTLGIVTSDRLGHVTGSVSVNENTIQTNDGLQTAAETSVLRQRIQAFSGDVAARSDRRNEVHLPPNTIPPSDTDGSMLRPNTIPTADTPMPPMEPSTIPPSINPRAEERPNTIPTADIQLRPQTIPPADDNGDQLKPNTLPTSDQSDVQLRPNTIPTSPEPQPNTIPTSTRPIVDQPDSRLVASVVNDPQVTGIGGADAQSSESRFLHRSNHPNASSQINATAAQDTADRGTSMPTTAFAEGRSNQVQTQLPTSFATAISGNVDTPRPTSLTGQLTPSVQGQTAQAPMTQAPPISATGAQMQSSARDAPPLRTGGWTIAPAAAPTPTVAAAMPSIIQAPATQLAAASTPDVALEALSDLDFALQTSLSGVSTTALTPSVSIAGQAPSATAQVIAQQLATALSNSGASTDTPLELALDPPELGRVRMQISDVSGVMTLMIQAERPETADLMRRHLELLAQEFAQAGLDAPSVHISQDGSDQDRQSAEGRSADAPFSSADHPADHAPPPPTIRTASGGLDLRL